MSITKFVGATCGRPLSIVGNGLARSVVSASLLAGMILVGVGGAWADNGTFTWDGGDFYDYMSGLTGKGNVIIISSAASPLGKLYLFEEGREVTIRNGSEHDNGGTVCEIYIEHASSKVIWDAQITGASTSEQYRHGTVKITGKGSFEVIGGSIKNTNRYSVTHAITNESTGSVTISGGRVSAVDGGGYAIYNYGDITNGTINISGNAIVTSASTAGTIFNHASNGIINVTGGTVENTNEFGGTAIYNHDNGTTNGVINISGGRVSAVGGHGIAIRNHAYYGTINISGDAMVTSEYASHNNTNGGTIYNNTGAGTINITGGTVENTSAANRAVAIFNIGKVNVSGGAVSVASSNMSSAIYNYNYAGTLDISDGTVSATTGDAIRMVGDGGHANISGGTVSATTGRAIQIESGAATVDITGGTVSATTGQAINNYSTGTVTVSGGAVAEMPISAFRAAAASGATVKSTTGYAIYNAGIGEINILKGATVTSGNSTGTIYLNAEGSMLTINGGTITNTGSGSAIAKNSTVAGVAVTVAPPTISGGISKEYDGESAALVSNSITGAEVSVEWNKDGAGFTPVTDADVTDVAQSGTYVIKAKAIFAGFESACAEETVTVDITPAPLTVTAENKTITYGDAAPAYTVAYSGFVLSQSAADLGGTLSVTSLYTQGDDVTDYDITPSGLTSDNYAINFVKGTLTVNKSTPAAPPAISAADVTDVSVTLLPNAAYEFSRDGTAWQASSVFDNLTPETPYTFYQRVAATANTNASPPSPAFNVSTAMTSVASSDRVVPSVNTENGAAIIIPTNPIGFELTVGPNPVSRGDGVVKFFVGATAPGRPLFGIGNITGKLTIYDATGNVVKKINIRDDGTFVGDDGNRPADVSANPSRADYHPPLRSVNRIIGSWDLKDRKGRPISDGTYLIRGFVKTVDGKREKVSVIIGVR